MKRKILYMAVAVIAALSSCSNEDMAGNNGNSGSNGDGAVFTGTVEGVTSKSTLTSENKVNWESTDEISINGVAYTTTPGNPATTATFAKKNSTDANPTAPYEAAFQLTETVSGGTTTFSLPASYTYSATQFNMPMYAKSDTKDLKFKNICGVLAVKVTSAEMKKVTSIIVTSDKAISGACTISDAGDGKYYAEATGTADADKTVTLDCGDGVAPAENGTVFYLPLPALTDATLYVTVMGDISDAKAAGYKNLIYTQSMKGTGMSIARNSIYPVTFATSLAQFKVGADSKVNFTKSNIYWDGSALQFEANQTDYPTKWDASHVGHFYWNSTLESSVAETYTATGNSTYFESKVTVDGTSDLRILTGGENGEYKYLFNTRGEGNLYKNSVTVGSAENCLIIAPDNFVGAIKDKYTDEAELKAYGLVCLAAAGYRDANTLKAGNSDARYWSSTRYGNLDINAYGLYSKYNGVTIADYGRDYGFSIRLVKKNETTTPTLTIEEGTYGF